jgi:hypothetical protein
MMLIPSRDNFPALVKGGIREIDSFTPVKHTFARLVFNSMNFFFASYQARSEGEKFAGAAIEFKWQ